MNDVFNENANILWVDFLANGERLANEEEQVKLIKQAVESGITHMIIDAKVPFGQTTYPSNYAHHISSWSDGSFSAWKNRDFLKEFLSKMKDIKHIKVLANVDVFSEGITSSRDGMAYDKPEWQVTFYNDAVSNESNAAEYSDAATIFVNPIHPEVVEYELNIIKEICTYNLDGIVVDRCRYPNIYGDFSDLSRIGFESYIGKKVINWPEDIFTIDKTKEINRGALFPKWTEWRALNIKNFVSKARELVKSANPNLIFSDYVGSWYPLYYSEGVNWGSETYHPDLEWTSKTHNVSGLAEQLDFIMTGCYYPEVYVEEAEQNGRPAEWYSVEGAIDKSLEVINGSIPVVGSLFLKDYTNNPDQFRKAIRMCKEKSAGVMIFDTVYLEEYNWWDILAEELNISKES
ncbi:alpha amylase family protein [Psychrobacillus sp. BL-248-WT-3]|uniref:alpha amylase family protein n=1 Tax=Psychrobacillus sp. BL-248-WT-3 TaxID=2725306 RepID=UPI00146E6DBB|nr:alpha amylase family protein [Psychrobacillus sp. BL-248-WT-3]NME06826.1 family 10 glycosylhydrolase [Psychrobacillus sp. BL-248-WT-3]